MIDWGVILDALPAYFDGLRITLTLLAIALAAGFLFSIPLATLRVSRYRLLSGPVFLFTYVIRGTPLLVQLFMLYFGLAQFEAVRESWAWTFLRSPWFCAWLAFTLNTSAYTDLTGSFWTGLTERINLD
jgi:arginine/ornithine transport system permease protein